MLNWISSACIVLAGQAGPPYVNTKISMTSIERALSCPKEMIQKANFFLAFSRQTAGS